MLATKTTDQEVNELIFASLLQLNASGELEPCLAESYTVSEDGLKFTFNLRKDAVWHDDIPITAEDVLYTIQCILDPGFTGTSYKSFANIKGAVDYHDGKSDKVEGVEVVDEHTVVFTLNESFAPVLTRIGLCSIIPKHIWGEIPVAEHENAVELMKSPIGSGPYKVVENVEGQYVKMVANDKYWEGVPKTQNFIIKVVAVDGIAAEMQNKTLDVVSVRDLSSDDRALIKEMGNEIYSFPNNIYRYIGINLRKSVFQDKALREALYYAIDRESIVTNLLEGEGTVINSPFLPSGWVKEENSNFSINKIL